MTLTLDLHPTCPPQIPPSAPALPCAFFYSFPVNTSYNPCALHIRSVRSCVCCPYFPGPTSKPGPIPNPCPKPNPVRSHALPVRFRWLPHESSCAFHRVFPLRSSVHFLLRSPPRSQSERVIFPGRCHGYIVRSPPKIFLFAHPGVPLRSLARSSPLFSWCVPLSVFGMFSMSSSLGCPCSPLGLLNVTVLRHRRLRPREFPVRFLKFTPSVCLCIIPRFLFTNPHVVRCVYPLSSLVFPLGFTRLFPCTTCAVPPGTLRRRASPLAFPLHALVLPQDLFVRSRVLPRAFAHGFL